jgi:hypothetical protein
MALFKYPGKKTWWYEFHSAGQKVRESAKTRSKEMARRAENAAAVTSRKAITD